MRLEDELLEEDLCSNRFQHLDDNIEMEVIVNDQSNTEPENLKMKKVKPPPIYTINSNLDNIIKMIKDLKHSKS